MTIFKTETKKTLQTGTHVLSNFSKLRINSYYNPSLIELSFGTVREDSGWAMGKKEMKELIDLLTEIHDVMEY